MFNVYENPIETLIFVAVVGAVGFIMSKFKGENV